MIIHIPTNEAPKSNCKIWKYGEFGESGFRTYHWKLLP